MSLFSGKKLKQRNLTNEEAVPSKEVHEDSDWVPQITPDMTLTEELKVKAKARRLGKAVPSRVSNFNDLYYNENSLSLFSIRTWFHIALLCILLFLLHVTGYIDVIELFNLYLKPNFD